jgi:hypothetical protein
MERNSERSAVPIVLCVDVDSTSSLDENAHHSSSSDRNVSECGHFSSEVCKLSTPVNNILREQEVPVSVLRRIPNDDGSKERSEIQRTALSTVPSDTHELSSRKGVYWKQASGDVCVWFRGP